MPRTDLAGIAHVLREAGSFLITSHFSPDGDAIGSMLGVYHFLRALGKTDITCLNDDPVPRIYQWLPGAEKIQVAKPEVSPVSAEITVMVDAAQKERLGRTADAIAPTTRIVVLDHHLEDQPEGDVIFVDETYCAVGEILVELFAVAGLPISREAAECTYVSIVTDTGGFRFANTRSHSLRIAADLIETGLDVADIALRVFDVVSLAKFEVMRRVMQRLERIENGQLAYSRIKMQDIEDAAATSEDLDGLTNLTRNIEGVVVGVLFRELDAQTTKVSMRSRSPFNCVPVLKSFGGGGHAEAAGATLSMPLADAETQILNAVRRELHKINNEGIGEVE